MAEQRLPTLIDMEDADLTVRDPADDIRGRTVLDPHGDELGEVDGLLVDEAENRVRFLRLASGGLLGFGRTKRLIPVEAITGIDEKTVRIDRAKEQVADSAPYDPPLLDEHVFYQDLYQHYGVQPFWITGYRYPF
ncbi:PRC-barrel domain-containing protein [Nocardia amikacinitolerans]|uniref:PRC-barrel domain-containing protein n=1 Tax=Nocardia amikacinitolerans TaxID=756689 RepID=UPI00082959C7|nr:PRC-barrel domain-containing protein [Nocardia amikacinitolerans]MCP2317732.1 PRC-barrel domain-containing protein [Nocardia amikacinitolerans]